MATYTDSTDIAALIDEARTEAAACRGGPDAEISDLLDRLTNMVGNLQQERDEEIRRYVDGLHAWRRNNAYHATEIERLKAEVARLSTALLDNTTTQRALVES